MKEFQGAAERTLLINQRDQYLEKQHPIYKDKRKAKTKMEIDLFELLNEKVDWNIGIMRTFFINMREECETLYKDGAIEAWYRDGLTHYIKPRGTESWMRLSLYLTQ